jgi:hypothetical protein
MTGLVRSNNGKSKKFKIFQDSKVQLLDEEAHKLAKTDSLK